VPTKPIEFDDFKILKLTLLNYLGMLDSSSNDNPSHIP